MCSCLPLCNPEQDSGAGWRAPCHDTARGLFILTHDSRMAEFAAVPILETGAEGEVFREAASTIADKQVLIDQGLQCAGL